MNNYVLELPHIKSEFLDFNNAEYLLSNSPCKADFVKVQFTGSEFHQIFEQSVRILEVFEVKFMGFELESIPFKRLAFLSDQTYKHFEFICGIGRRISLIQDPVEIEKLKLQWPELEYYPEEDILIKPEELGYINIHEFYMDYIDVLKSSQPLYLFYFENLLKIELEHDEFMNSFEDDEEGDEDGEIES